MDLEIRINVDNAAFSDDPSIEVARLLRGIADRVEGKGRFPSCLSFKIMDINGNTCGHLKVIE